MYYRFGTFFGGRKQGVIGSIRIADIPLLVIGFVIGVALLSGFIGLFEYGILNARTMPSWTFCAVLIFILVTSYLFATFIWNRIQKAARKTN